MPIVITKNRTKQGGTFVTGGNGGYTLGVAFDKHHAIPQSTTHQYYYVAETSAGDWEMGVGRHFTNGLFERILFIDSLTGTWLSLSPGDTVAITLTTPPGVEMLVQFGNPVPGETPSERYQLYWNTQTNVFWRCDDSVNGIGQFWYGSNGASISGGGGE